MIRSFWSWLSLRFGSCCRVMSFRGDDIPVIPGSALAALAGRDEEVGEETIEALMSAVDEYVPQPDRPKDMAFLMPIEDVFSISGRGTVVTGRIERGVVKVGEEVEIVGLHDTSKTTVTGVEMFRKLLDEGEAGDNVGCLLRGVGRDEVERGSGVGASWLDHAAHAVYGGGLHSDEGGGRSSYAVFLELPSAVLFPDDGCDGSDSVAGGHGDDHAGGQRDDGG